MRCDEASWQPDKLDQARARRGKAGSRRRRGKQRAEVRGARCLMDGWGLLLHGFFLRILAIRRRGIHPTAFSRLF